MRIEKESRVRPFQILLQVTGAVFAGHENDPPRYWNVGARRTNSRQADFWPKELEEPQIIAKRHPDQFENGRKTGQEYLGHILQVCLLKSCRREGHTENKDREAADYGSGIFRGLDRIRAACHEAVIVRRAPERIHRPDLI